MQVLIIDDHALFRAGVSLLLREMYPNIDIVEAGTLGEGMQVALTQPLNMLFLDLDLPDGYGLDGLVALKQKRPSLPVVVMSADETTTTIHRALELHATGFVPKSQKPEVLHAALQSALAGGVFLPASVIDEVRRGMSITHASHAPREASRASAPAAAAASPSASSATRAGGYADFGLTPREFETLRWLVRGLPTKTIASRMGLEDITVRKYVSQLLAHFNVRRRTELIVMLAESGTKLGTPPVSDPVADRC